MLHPLRERIADSFERPLAEESKKQPKMPQLYDPETGKRLM